MEWNRIREVIKMKRKIVFGSLLACFLMLVTPVIPAIDFNNVEESIESEIKNLRNNKNYIKQIIQKMNGIYCRKISKYLLSFI